jgi:hypothetical protein
MQYQTNIGNGGLHFIDFPNILVPEDAYPLLDAMREMSNELQEKLPVPALLIGERKVSTKMEKLSTLY